MKSRNIHAVTGAFGYSGKYIAKRLLAEGRNVITLTNSIHRVNPFGDQLRAFPFHFDDPEKLTESLRDVSVLYNTYWVRFNHRDFTYADAVRNTMILFDSAKAAGVDRVVHVSITNPSEDSPLEYFSGKARLERAGSRKEKVDQLIEKLEEEEKEEKEEQEEKKEQAEQEQEKPD